MLLHYLVKCTQRIVHETVDLLRQETPDFILPDLWHSNSPELNPVDYVIWVIMQRRVYQTKKIRNVDERKRPLIDFWYVFEQSTGLSY